MILIIVEKRLFWIHSLGGFLPFFKYSLCPCYVSGFGCLPRYLCLMLIFDLFQNICYTVLYYGNACDTLICESGGFPAPLQDILVIDTLPQHRTHLFSVPYLKSGGLSLCSHNPEQDCHVETLII